MSVSTGKSTKIDTKYHLNKKQELFCTYYAETGNGRQSVIRAGYSEVGAEVTASRLLNKPNVIQKIRDILDSANKGKIATAQEVMQYFTDVMNGNIKDQFGLEASLSERTKAAQELAKRTVDLENRVNGKADAVMEIKLNWKR